MEVELRAFGLEIPRRRSVHSERPGASPGKPGCYRRGNEAFLEPNMALEVGRGQGTWCLDATAQNGKELPGQRQRLTIARALVREP